MASKIQRINISFPKKVADELASFVPHGKRSHLIVEATRKELKKVKTLRVLEGTAGGWTDANHPDLKTIEDIRAWVDNLRKSDESRIAKLAKKK